MAMNWIYQSMRGVGVIELRGYIGDSALARFSGAIGWTLERCAGPVVIDLTWLQGCSASGEAVFEEAAERAAAAGRILAVCSPHGIDTRRPWHDQQVTIPVYADLHTAVAAVSSRQREILSPG